MSNTTELVRINPESLEVVQTYLSTLSREKTARELGTSIENIAEVLDLPEVKRFIDNAYLEQGYLNRFKLQGLMDEMIEQKLEQMRETELASDKDIYDWLNLAHKMRKDELDMMAKRDALGNPNNSKTVNIQNNNYGENHTDLIRELIKRDGEDQ